MAMLRLDQDKLSFRLEQKEVAELLDQGYVRQDHMFFSYMICVAGMRGVTFDGTMLTLYATEEDCMLLQQERPNKEGIKFTYKDYNVQLMVNVRAKQ